MRCPRERLDRIQDAVLGLLFAASFCLVGLPEALAAKAVWTDSPLPVEAQSALTKAGRMMKSGKFDRAKPAVLAVLETANDVPKCLAIAQYTESYGYPMMEVRRQCLNKALSLCQNEEDYILLALKSRKYQFFEITRQSMSSLIQTAKTMPQLYDLARKAQEVALNDLAHMAMEKAYSGLQTEEQAFVYADHCKDLGMDDLLRKTLKQMVDDEDDSGALCDMALKIEKFNMRDLNRYLLRKALECCKTVPDMEAIQEVGRRLNEPDVVERARYFVKKGKLIQKIKGDQVEHAGKVRAWRESNDLEQARKRDAASQAASEAAATDQAGFGSSNPATPKSPERSNASSGY